MVEYVKKTKSRVISSFMWNNWMLIDLQEDQSISPAEFRIYSKKRKIDVTDEV